MRYPPDHKQKTRERILDAAARTFRRHGYSATGIDRVMAEAGLTAGAFYGHFESKEDLLRAMMKRSFAEGRPYREKELDSLEGAGWVCGLIENYLSVEHLDSVETGCPLPALTPELSRADSRIREGFERQILAWGKELAATLTAAREDREGTAPGDGGENGPDPRHLALGAISTMVGAMALARVFPDRERAELLLEGAREMATASLRGDRPTPPAQPEPSAASKTQSTN